MNQHYVPRVYLKNFAVKKNKDYYVDVFDKIENRLFNTNIKKICVEKDLYTLTDSLNFLTDKYIVEKFFSEVVEPMYEKSYNILVNDNITYISRLQRVEILIGLFQLYSRNSFLLKKSFATHQKNIKALYSKAVRYNEPFLEYNNIRYDLKVDGLDSILNDISERILKYFKERNILGINELGSFHENAIIQVDKIEHDSNFLTGDKPIPQYDGLTNNLNPLLLSKEFFIPLNTKYCVTLYHDNSKRQNMIYRTLIPNGAVAMINDKTYEQSLRFVIGSKHALDEYSELSKILENTDLNQLMNVIEQAINLGPAGTEAGTKAIHNHYPLLAPAGT